ncbi:glycosyltransferase [Sulfitobacter pacificus]|uniref:glycosyltransferase n=1 Tax=Sulfitobacter pacificus TaxID=1499314 RepID=UPI00360635DA
MELLSAYLIADADAPALPDDICEWVGEAVRGKTSPKDAEALFDEIKPILAKHSCDEAFVLNLALLIEKQRKTSGMIEFWQDVQRRYPDNPIAVRMVMRWYRRARQIDEGLQRLYQMFPDHRTCAKQASVTLLGLSELKAFHDMDELMSVLEVDEEDSRSLKMRYIKSLSEQSRFAKAKEVAETVKGQDKMGASSRVLLETVTRAAETADRRMVNDQGDVIKELVRLAGHDPRPLGETGELGPVVFFTGQLGTGGAERQLTRIVSEFAKRERSGTVINGTKMTGPFKVCVKHANPTTNSDFFLPVLRRGNVDTTILVDLPDLSVDDIEDIDPAVRDLLKLLPEDILNNTLKLIPYFRETNCEIANLWQDGGVLAAAIAALIAKVPRIVTSFRGMPPNLRKELFRPQLAPLYKSLAGLDHVSFSSNSRAAGALYEEWLELENGAVKTIRNASHMPDPKGSSDDEAWWADVEERSAGTDRTVLGVFRFDPNKRPLYWVDVAHEVIKQRPDTRFVIVGSGIQFVETQEKIVELGLQDRVFLAGVRENVGFFYHKADLVMHLAKMEGLPNVLIEAQLAGLPVLATPAGGTDEVVMNGQTGKILSRADAPRWMRSPIL